MKGDKVKMFMELAGQDLANTLDEADPESRKLGAQLLLSETLEYIIHGLGVTPSINGVEIREPDVMQYSQTSSPDHIEMLDGLADVAFTMYWNALRFGLPLEKAFGLVCDNNLEKFVELESSFEEIGELSPDRWNCGRDILWPAEVVKVEIVEVSHRRYAVGTDANGKVRKPSSYQPVDLKPLLA